MRSATLPFGLAVAFCTIIEGLGLSEFLPLPIAILAGAAWGVGIALVATWIGGKSVRSAWFEDALVCLGVVAMAIFAFAGAVGILIYSNALESSSLTGETMVLLFLPSLPVAIVTNVLTELFVVPGLLILGWRQGMRRTLILAAAGSYFVHRVWTYLVFASDRLDFAETERSTAPLTAAERARFRSDLHLDDPRWMLNLVIFAVFLLAAHLSRVRAIAGRVETARPGSPLGR